MYYLQKIGNVYSVMLHVGCHTKKGDAVYVTSDKEDAQRFLAMCLEK